MKLYLTKGMFGDRLEQIGDETKNVKTILEYIFGWKNNDEHRHQYKIENFDRFVFQRVFSKSMYKDLKLPLAEMTFTKDFINVVSD